MLKTDVRLLDPNDNTPIIAIDIDGVLNFTGRHAPQGVAFHKYRILRYPIYVRTDIQDVLAPLLAAAAAGKVTLAWGTMWEEQAPTNFAPIALNNVGADWPVIYFETDDPDASVHARKLYQDRQRASLGFDINFKTPGIAELAHVTNRPIVWLDDMITSYDRHYLRSLPVEHKPVAIRISEERGLDHEAVDYVLNSVLAEVIA